MAEARIDHARRRMTAGDIVGARRDAETILAGAADPRESAAAHLLLAACCQKNRDNAGARSHAHAAIALTPHDALAHYALAEAEEAAADKNAAVASLRRAIGLDPRFVQAYHYLGIVLGESGEPDAAVEAFERALRLDPNHARAWNNLGNAQRALRRHSDAARSFARALAIKPDYPLATANLASLLRDTGEVERAEAMLRDALAQQSGEPFRPLLVVLAGLLRERGVLDEAAQLYVRAIQAAPQQSAGEWFNLGWVLHERGEPERARDAFTRAYAADRRELRAEFGRRLELPMIYADGQALAAARTAYASGLDTLEKELDQLVSGLAEKDVLDGLRWTNFFLAYQGQDDCALQSAYAALLARAIDTVAPHWRTPLTGPPLQGRRIRVGFASAFFHVGTCGRYFSSWITDLDPKRFEVFVYHLFPGMDDIATAIERRADHFRTFGGSDSRPSIVAPAIRADALDVLIYPELGMDVSSFVLGALRLAPRQYAGWGHPVTTGHQTIDGFISCEAMEPQGCDAHYTEPVIKLPGIGTRYARLDVPAPADRQDLGLPDDRTLLLCPQSLFKIHPDNDELFAEVLVANPQAMLVLFAGRHPAITDQYMRRLSRAFERRGLPIRERTRVIPQLGHDDYLRVNLACDAMLDTLHWSGGNTSLDALACGLPIATLPGAYMRGRQSAGMLTLLGVPELIARDRGDYVAIASRLVGEPAWRDGLRRRILSAHDRLFDVPDAIERLQELLQAETARAV